MSDQQDKLALVLKRQASLDRQMDALTQSILSMTRMFEAQFRDVHARLDGMDRMVRTYASEQITMANQIINAEDGAVRAHRRLDEIEAR